MSRRKRKIRYDRIAILVLGALAIFGLVVFGSLKLFNYLFDDDNTVSKPVNDPITAETKNDIKISLGDYSVYKTGSDLDFDFVIAEFAFESDEAFEYSFSNLETEEKVALDDVYSFTKKIENANYNLASFNLMNAVRSDEKTAVAKVLIPVKKSIGSEFAVYRKDTGEAFRIDTSLNQKDIAELKSKTNTEVAVSKDLKMYISDTYASEALYRNDNEISCPPNMSVLTIRLTVTSAAEDVKVTEAKFVVQKGDNTVELEALDRSYSSMKLDNILGTELKSGDSKGLFFYTNDNIGYEGTLKIRLSSSNDWIEITTAGD